MRRLGAKSITALFIPEREVARQILALNTEKAHNLKERSLEVIRIYRGLVDEDGSRPESGFAFYLDEASLVTLGVATNESPASVVALTILCFAALRTLATSQCALRLSSTRSAPRSCSNSRKGSPP
jgi:hypothetical protein